MRYRNDQFDPRIRILFWGQIISSTGRLMVFPFMALYLRQQLGVEMTAIGFYLGLSSLAGLATSFIGGTVSDRIGRKPVLIGSMAGEALILALFPLASTLQHFVVLNSLLSAVNALFAPANLALITDLTLPEMRARAYGLIRVAGNLGAVIGPLTGSVLVAISFAITFWSAALLSLLYAAILFLLLTESTSAKNNVQPAASPVATGYYVVVKDSLFLLVMSAFILVSISYAQIDSLMPIYIKETLALPETVYGVLMAVNGGMIVLFQTAISTWTERHESSRFLITSGILYAAGYLITGSAGTVSALVLGMVVITCAEMIGFPTYIKFIGAIAPEQLRGRYMAIGDLPFNISRILGPLLGGLVSDTLGASAIWTMAATLSACTAITYMALSRSMNLREQNFTQIG